MNSFKQLLQNADHHLPVGTWLLSASPLMAEAVGLAGFDWAVVDMEHSPLDLMPVVGMLQAIAGTPMTPVLRVPWNDTVTIKRVLDAGATTLMVPFVQNVEEAQRAVDSTRYPPMGIRGMAGMSRGARYGTVSDYLTSANDGICVILQIETILAVDHLEAIVSVDGVDALFLGPADLSASMGFVGQITHPSVIAVLADAVQRCHAVGKPVGIVGGTSDQVALYQALGFDFLSVGSDLGLLVTAGQLAANAVRTQAQRVNGGATGGTRIFTSTGY